MSAFDRPLTGRVVNLSISESDDSVARGFPSWQVNRVTLQIVAALLGQGAGVVFGHDWREDGVMEAVYGLARQVQPPVPSPRPDVAADNRPMLQNFLPWPDEPMLSSEDRERLGATLRVERAGLPPELKSFAVKAKKPDRASDQYQYLRARGLTHLRRRLGEECLARFCLGGRRGGSSGRFPGVIEEAFMSVQAGTPLYVAGLLGGAARQIVDALAGKSMPEEFCHPKRLPALHLYKEFGTQFGGPADDLVTDREVVWAAFVNAGKSGRFADANRLSRDDNTELFHTPVLERAIEIVLVGLARLRPDDRRGGSALQAF